MRMKFEPRALIREIIQQFKYLFEILGQLRFLSKIFNDWLTRTAGVVFLLFLANLAFNVFFLHFREQYPFVNLLSLISAMGLLMLGGFLFFVAIIKYHE